MSDDDFEASYFDDEDDAPAQPAPSQTPARPHRSLFEEEEPTAEELGPYGINTGRESCPQCGARLRNDEVICGSCGNVSSFVQRQPKSFFQRYWPYLLVGFLLLGFLRGCLRVMMSN